MVQRVAIVVEQNWNAVPGGTARSTNRLVDELLQVGDVELIGVHGRNGAPVLPLPRGLRTTAVPVPGRVLTQVWSRVARPRIDRFTGAVDLVHSPGYLFAPASVPSVATVHDLAFLRRPEWFTPNGVGFLTRFLDRVRKSDGPVIVPSASTADECAEAGIDESRITVVPWGSDAVEVAPEEVVDVRRRLNLPERFAAYLGTREPRKNLDGLLAAQAHTELPLVLVGPEGWGEVDTGGAMAVGDVPDADVHRILAAAEVLAYPSHHEGFGLPVLEALAQGAPVVVTAGTAPAEIAGGCGLAVDTTDAVALGEAIDRAAAGRHDAQMIAERRSRAGEFRWSETAARTVEVYRSVG